MLNYNIMNPLPTKSDIVYTGESLSYPNLPLQKKHVFESGHQYVKNNALSLYCLQM